MDTVHAIEDAVRTLSPGDLAAFRRWFAEFDSGLWDRRLKADAKAGRLDALADETLDDLRQGRSTEL